MKRVPLLPLVLLPLALAGQDGPAPARWDSDTRLTSNAAESRITYNFAKSIAAEGDNVYAVWYDTRDGGPQVYFKKSADGGKTWAPDGRLSGEPGAKEHPAIAVSGKNVYVTWHDTRNSSLDIYLKRSSNGGETWEKDCRLSYSGACAHSSVAATGRSVHVVYGNNKHGHAEICYRRSTDAGATWDPEVQLTELPWDSWVPCVAADGDVVCLAWVDCGDGNEEEYIRVSVDGGKAWGPITRITNNRMNSWAPSAAISGRAIHLVWFDQKENATDALDAERKLDEAMALVGLPPDPEPPRGVTVPHPELDAKARATQKLQKIRAEADAWVKKGGDASKLQKIMREFEEMARPPEPNAEAESKLEEVAKMVGLPPDPAPPEDETPAARMQRIQGRVAKIQQAAPGWLAGGGDRTRLESMMREFEKSMQGEHAASYMDKERKIDEALKLLELEFAPEPAKDVPRIYYMDSLGMRVADKMKRLRKAGPGWVKNGGDPKKLEALFGEFERLMRIANEEWEIYCRRSDDAGTTWGSEVRLTNAKSISQRPSIAIRGAELHVVWFDNRDGNVEAYYKRSLDAGASWETDVRLTEADGESMHPTVSASSSGIHVLWFDSRDGNTEIYYKRGR